MPVELLGLIASENFYYLSGFAGLSSGFIVWLIWSRGL